MHRVPVALIAMAMCASGARGSELVRPPEAPDVFAPSFYREPDHPGRGIKRPSQKKRRRQQRRGKR